MDICFRSAESGDLAEALAINEAVVPAVNSLTEASVLDMCRYPVDLLVGFYQGSSYASENYRWFAARYRHFAYVDRVAVHDAARRQGIASRLYQDFVEHIPANIPLLTCEVNTRPANPGSMRFHERLGFEQVGAQETAAGEKAVALLAKELAVVT